MLIDVIGDIFFAGRANSWVSLLCRYCPDFHTVGSTPVAMPKIQRVTPALPKYPRERVIIKTSGIIIKTVGIIIKG